MPASALALSRVLRRECGEKEWATAWRYLRESELRFASARHREPAPLLPETEKSAARQPAAFAAPRLLMPRNFLLETERWKFLRCAFERSPLRDGREKPVASRKHNTSQQI